MEMIDGAISLAQISCSLGRRSAKCFSRRKTHEGAPGNRKQVDRINRDCGFHLKDDIVPDGQGHSPTLQRQEYIVAYK